MLGPDAAEGRQEQLASDSAGPAFAEILRDLKRVRSAGVGRLRSVSTPALERASVLLDFGDGDGEPAPINEVLCRVVAALGGGSEQEEAEYLLGLVPGTLLWPSGERLKEAAQIRGISVEAYRKKPTDDLLRLLAEGVLGLLHDARMRRASVEMKERRHPADSRLAVQWVERFEAYYAIWTPAYALAADLEAALECYTHEPSEHLPWDPDSAEPYDPIAQARGYARSALYWYAAFHLELRRFRTAHGGLWLASSTDVEQEIADSVYRITWHNDINDEDESWLRRQLADSRREENDHFVDVVLRQPRGLQLHNEWQEQVRASVGLAEDAKFSSQGWLTIRACQDYCRLIDEDWLRIADWYRPRSTRSDGVSGSALLNEHNHGLDGITTTSERPSHLLHNGTVLSRQDPPKDWVKRHHGEPAHPQTALSVREETTG